MFNHHRITAVVVFLTACGYLSAEDLPASQVEKLLTRGGKHWSVSKVGFAKYATGKSPDVLYLWPEEDRIYQATMDASKRRVSFSVRFRWQLKPGAKFPEQATKYFLYQWGQPGGPQHGFQVTKAIDQNARSGSFFVNLNVPINEQREQEVVFALFHNARNAQPLHQFVRIKAATQVK